MIPAPIPASEEQRLHALHEAGILDTAPEREFDDIVALASEIAGTPISLISLVDRDRQWFKAKTGIEDHETSRDVSFCAHALESDGAFVINDALQDPRFHDNPFVTGDPFIRFYAGFPVRTHDGHCVGTLCVIGAEPRSISEREERALNVLARHVTTLIDLKRSQEITYRLFSELHIRQDNLERITQTATRLLSVIAHDVRGPLASIGQSLEMDLDTSEYPWLIEEIKRQTRTATTLLDEILTWARTMLQGGATVEGSVDVAHILREVARTATLDANRKGTSISVDAETMFVKTDPNLFRFVAHTLVTNAVKFTANGNVRVQLQPQDRTLVLRVQDNGLGMTSDTQRRLFDWKYRQSSRGTHDESGTGMALLLVKDFLSLLDATVDVHSTPGQGSTFTVSFAVP